MSNLLSQLADQARSRLRRMVQPSWTSPMLATLTREPFSGSGWICEPKLDGERCLAFRRGKKVRLLSRNQKNLNYAYPELVEAIQDQKADDFIADGEVVADGGKQNSFALLQRRMQVRDPDVARRTGVAVQYYLFDLLHIEGYDTTRLRLIDRKFLLKRAFSFKHGLRFTSHQRMRGEEYLERACRQGWEGLIAKQIDSQYAHTRSREWLKLKCSRGQEFVVGGYTDPKGSRTGLGALLIGYYQGKDLKYAGKVGTGYDQNTLQWLVQRLSPLQRENSPFTGNGWPRRNIHWVNPNLVVEIGFGEWTSDGRLRHPRFLGIRRDKRPREVRRENG